MKHFISFFAASLALLVSAVHVSAQTEYAVNGDFESGIASWEYFPTPLSTFEAVSSPTADVFSGSASGKLVNTSVTSAAVIKQANLGVGQISPGDEIEVSFWAKGEGVAGGVSFAEFFSEIDGGGTSSAEIFGGAPLGLTSTYQEFNFTTTAGADVSGGVTLQFTATTGGDPGSMQTLFVDNVSITTAAVPEPSALALIGTAGIWFMAKRRRNRHVRGRSLASS